MIKLNFTPLHLAFVNKLSMSFAPLLAVTDKESPAIKIIKAEQNLIDKKSEVS